MLLVYAMTREPARLGDGRDDRAARRLGGPDRRVRRRSRCARRRRCCRCASSGCARCGVERQRIADRRGDLLAVLPADPVHAAGAPLLGDQDGRRVHHPDPRDHRLLGRLAGARDPHRHPASSCRSGWRCRRSASSCTRSCRCTGTTSRTSSRPSSSAGSGSRSRSCRCRSARLTGVEPDDAGVASGLMNTNQQIGGAIGVAVATTIATTYTSHYVDGHPGVGAARRRRAHARLPDRVLRARRARSARGGNQRGHDRAGRGRDHLQRANRGRTDTRARESSLSR